MDMIKSRNKTCHTYNEETVEEIATAIQQKYFKEFIELEKELSDLEKKEQS